MGAQTIILTLWNFGPIRVLHGSEEGFIGAAVWLRVGCALVFHCHQLSRQILRLHPELLLQHLPAQVARTACLVRATLEGHTDQTMGVGLVCELRTRALYKLQPVAPVQG